jgi:hypothetical protein
VKPGMFFTASSALLGENLSKNTGLKICLLFATAGAFKKINTSKKQHSILVYLLIMLIFLL